MLGNGGTTAFWDAATFGLIEQRSQHLSFGEFSSKFAAAPTSAPHLDDARRHRVAPTARTPTPRPSPDVDAYCLTHNETSTGVAMPLRAARGRRRRWCWSTPPRPPAACASTPRQVDAYYFAPQKCLASDGGLWIAAVLARRRRAHRAHRGERPLGPGLRST